jgi:DivIVA domain-containing protein
MVDSLRPEDVTGRTFKPGWRGYDQGAVDAFLREVSSALSSLQEENERLRDRLRTLGDRDMHAEFDRVSSEVAEVLQGARETAEGMRFRASVDAEQIVEDARGDAVRLRQDAWDDGVALIEDTRSEAALIEEEARRASLGIISDAEREAHRIVSRAKKDADEATRRARLQAEQLVVEARARRDEMAGEGEAEVAAAHERVSVLMQRRDELLAEVAGLQSKIGELRSELEDRRAEIGKVRASDISTVRVLPPSTGGEATEPWAEGEESVRIVRPPKRLRSPADVDAEQMAAEVRKLRVPAQPQAAPPVAPPKATEAPEPRESTAAAFQQTVPGRRPRTGETGLEDLFASLRSATVVEPPVGVPAEPAASAELPEVARPEPVADPFELRDRLLLPITNKALRVVKRSLTDAQNIALDELRTQEDSWKPDVSALEEALADDLDELVRRSASAGWSAASQLLDRALEEGDVEADGATAHAFAAAIGDGVRAALDGAGEGPRRRAAAISRVYRAWRVDEAERRVRALAVGVYHDSLLEAFRREGITAVRWVLSGRGCVTCRAMVEAGPVEPGMLFAGEARRPPAHTSCGCTLVPA